MDSKKNEEHEELGIIPTLHALHSSQSLSAFGSAAINPVVHSAEYIRSVLECHIVKIKLGANLLALDDKIAHISKVNHMEPSKGIEAFDFI